VSSIDRTHLEAIRAHERLRQGGRVSGTDARTVAKAAGVSLRVPVVDEAEYTAAELGYDARQIWHDALVRIPLAAREHYLACRRRGEKLNQPPRVRISTIHGAKGLEADHVYLGMDLTPRTQRGFELDPDAEHRVFYVGATRARERLVLGAATGAYAYHV
jgi:hypothetical protein